MEQRSESTGSPDLDETSHSSMRTPWVIFSCSSRKLSLSSARSSSIMTKISRTSRASLGVEAFRQWGIYQNNVPVVAPETEDECLERCIREICTGITAFPAGDIFSEHARTTLTKCAGKFFRMSMDDTLLSLVEAEYRIFQAAESAVCLRYRPRATSRTLQ